MRCPYCKSEDIERYGVYEFFCNDCNSDFDIVDAKGQSDSFLDELERMENEEEDSE